MRLDPDISAGSLMVTFVLLGGMWRLGAMMRQMLHKMDIFSIEHEMLLGDFCKRSGVDIDSLPTRTRRA